MERELVSIIIPAYNVSAYISRGIKSCIDQTYKKIEIIIVDDGSTDCTWDIICGWQESDSRIKAFRQENCGVSVSRNVGLEHSGGGYILFLDGDDWLEQDAVAYLVKMIGGREDVIAVCGHYNVRSEKGILRRHHQKAHQAPGFVPAEKVLQSLLEGSYSLTSACYKLYPVHIIRELRFDPDIYNMEDGLFCFQAVGQSEGIIYSTEPKWNILFREGSFTRSGYNAKYLTAITAIERMMDHNKTSTVCPILVSAFFLRALQLLNDALLDPDKNIEDILFLREKIASYADSGVFYVKKFTTLLNAILILRLPVSIAAGYRKAVVAIRNTRRRRR